MSNSKSVLQKENVEMAFGTPISSYLWPDSDGLNTQLKNVILQKEKADKGVERSNVGGWHSKPDLFLWEAECARTLRERVATYAVDMTRFVTTMDRPGKLNLHMHGWANVSRRGHYNRVHDHPGTTMWSGAYYVSGGEPDGNDPLNGKLELLDPRVGMNIHPLEQGLLVRPHLVEPLPGLMVMFPSWLKHMVHPFQGSGERISISFNVFVQFEQQTS